MSEENKKDELEIIEFLHTVVPNETYFVFFGGFGYCGILAYWQFVKVKNNQTLEEWVERIPIVGHMDHSIEYKWEDYHILHWSEVREFIEYPHVEISRKERQSINRVLYRYVGDLI